MPNYSIYKEKNHGYFTVTNNNLSAINYCNDVFFLRKKMMYSPKAKMMFLFHKNDGFAYGKNVGSRFAA